MKMCIFFVELWNRISRFCFEIREESDMLNNDGKICWIEIFSIYTGIFKLTSYYCNKFLHNFKTLDIAIFFLRPVNFPPLFLIATVSFVRETETNDPNSIFSGTESLGQGSVWENRSVVRGRFTGDHRAIKQMTHTTATLICTCSSLPPSQKQKHGRVMVALRFTHTYKPHLASTGTWCLIIGNYCWVNEKILWYIIREQTVHPYLNSVKQ